MFPFNPIFYLKIRSDLQAKISKLTKKWNQNIENGSIICLVIKVCLLNKDESYRQYIRIDGDKI